MVKYYVEIDDWTGNNLYATFDLDDGTLTGKLLAFMRTPYNNSHTPPVTRYQAGFRNMEYRGVGTSDWEDIKTCLEEICKMVMPVHIQWRIPTESEQETLRVLYG